MDFKKFTNRNNKNTKKTGKLEIHVASSYQYQFQCRSKNYNLFLR